MIFYLIAIILILYAMSNYKNSFFLYLGFKLFLNQNITLISIPGIPTLTLDLVLTWVYFILLITIKRDSQKASASFPLKIPMLFLTLSYFLSSIFGIAPFSVELASFIKYLADSVLIIWMVWQVVETRSDFNLVLKYLSVVFAFSIGYGVFEYITSANPIIIYEQTLNYDAEKVVNNIYSSSGLRGYRVQSIFIHAIGAGMNWAIFYFWIVSIKIREKTKLPVYYIVIAIGCIVCCIMTKCRSSYVFLIILTLGLVDFKSKKFYNSLPAILIIICLLIPFFLQYYDIFRTMLSIDSINKYTAGSSITMRLSQFSAAINLLLDKPIFGYGSKFLNYMSNQYTAQLLGLESVWLNAITKFGLFGVTSYLISLIYDVFVIPKKYSVNRVLVIGLAYWVTYTASSVPGFQIYLLYLVLFYFLKSSDYYTKKREQSEEHRIFFIRGKIIFRKTKKQR